ncbi:MAG: hypothetical protein QXL01_00415 [Thermoplasmatales archaeon]
MSCFIFLGKNMLKYLISLFFLVLLSCGTPQEGYRRDTRTGDAEGLEELRRKYLELAGTLDGLVTSDFKDCSGVGETANVIIQNICKFAQAATSEVRVELANKLAAHVRILQERLDSGDLDTISLAVQIGNINNDLAVLKALVNAGMTDVVIAAEVLSAGPLYETLLRRSDKGRINAYVEAYGQQISLGDNPATATNGSSVVTIQTGFAITSVNTSADTMTLNNHQLFDTEAVRFSSTGTIPAPLVGSTTYYVCNTTANTWQVKTASDCSGAVIDLTSSGSGIISILPVHGLSNGDIVFLSQLSEGRGFASGDLFGEFTVSSATVTSFQITARRNATASGVFGGTIGIMKRVIGRGMSTIATNTDADNTDTAVRQANLGSKRWNFIVKEFTATHNGELYVCYSLSSGTASFATINAAVAADINDISDSNSNGLFCK